MSTWLHPNQSMLFTSNTISNLTPRPGMDRLSGNPLCPLPNKRLPICRFLFGESCCGVKELVRPAEPGNMPDVGVTWPERELVLNPPPLRFWLAMLLGGCWKFRLAIAYWTHRWLHNHTPLFTNIQIIINYCITQCASNVLSGHD